MNRIEIENDQIKLPEKNTNFEVTWSPASEDFEVDVLTIHCIKHTQIELFCHFNQENKLQMNIIVEPNVDCALIEWKQGKNCKIQSRYDIRANSHLTITKCNHLLTSKENTIAHLNGENATLSFVLKTVAHSHEKYDTLIYHNFKQTTSQVIHHGIAEEKGEILFHVSTFIEKGKTGCNANQINRIINLNNNNSSIKPNLFIDECDVIANHSAHIGTFAKDQFFYLERLGIDHDSAKKLLQLGFLKSHLSITEEKKDDVIKFFNE